MARAVLAPAARAASNRRRRAADLLIAGALGAAGLSHLALIPAHFAESTLTGTTFVAMATLQLSVTYGLLRRPERGTYRPALLATVPIAALWAITPLRAAPTLSRPEELDVWGGAAGAGFAIVFLIASGALGAGPGDPREPLVDAYTLSGDVSVTIPALGPRHGC